MDDFNLASLKESRNEYSSLLLKYLTPPIYHGFESMFSDIVQLCDENDEEEKYLMTFQNFLTRVPKWNNEMINTEVQRILDDSKCTYLSDLLTCVHVTHLKILTNVRVGKTNKKIDIDIPSLDVFIHQVYIECARKLYKRIYLYEMEIEPIVKQKYIREIEILIMDSIMDAIRLNMPIESILKAYLDESSEHDVYDKVEEIQVPFEETKTIEETNNVQDIEPMSVETKKEMTELENNLKLSLHEHSNKTSPTISNDIQELESDSISLESENNNELNTVKNDMQLVTTKPSQDIIIDTQPSSSSSSSSTLNVLDDVKSVPVSPKFIGDIGDESNRVSDIDDYEDDDDNTEIFGDYSDSDSRIRIFDDNNDNENIKLDFDEL